MVSCTCIYIMVSCRAGGLLKHNIVKALKHFHLHKPFNESKSNSRSFIIYGTQFCLGDSI